MDSQDKNKNAKQKSDNEDDAGTQTNSNSVNTPNVITLEGTHLGSTDTEGTELKESKRVSFKEKNQEEQPSSSQVQPVEAAITATKREENDAMAIENDTQSALPQSESDDNSNLVTEQPRRSSEMRMHRILHLLDNFTRNLETIEDRIISSGNKNTTSTPPPSQPETELNDIVQVNSSRYEIYHEKAKPQIEAHECRSSRSSKRSSWSSINSRQSSEIRITQGCLPLFSEPYTDLVARGSEAERAQPTYVLDLKSNTQSSTTALTKKPSVRPPCELTYHTITISTSPTLQNPNARRPDGTGSRFAQTMGDCMAAICLCLQVNKDCVFCLGFFIAFVVSASFLTAFFYRTLSLSPQTIRIHQEEYITEPTEETTIRLNGFYYIYNNHRHHPNFG